MQNTDNNKQIAKNTAMLYMRMLFSMIVSLYTSRVILNALGVEDFGIYNVVGGIVVLFGFLNSAMAAATQRFLTFEMGKGDVSQLKRIFSMSITIHALIAVLVLILSETAGLWILNTQLNISAARMNTANWVYQFSILSFIVNILYVPFNATIIAHERMNVYAIVSIIEVLLKLLIAILIVWIGFDKLKFYAILIFCVSLVISSIYTIYCRHSFDETKFHYFWDKHLFKEMSLFANWNLLGVFAGITYGQGVNLLLNIFFGPTVNAARGVAFQVQGAVNAFVTNIQVAVNPPITKAFAMDDFEYMYSLIFSASKYSFYLLLLLSLPVIIETEFVLNLWLKTVPLYTIIFTRLTLLDVLIGSLSGSLQTLAQATGNIRRYQLVVSGILLLNLPFSYILLKLGFAPQVTFVVSLVASAIALIARLIVLKKIILFPIRRFFNAVVYKVIAVFFIAGIVPCYVSTQITGHVVQFISVLIISILSVISTVWLLGINKLEREYLKISILKFISLKTN